MASAERGEKLRRLVHILTSSFIVYYWIPPRLLGIYKEYWLVTLLAIVLLIDSYRMHTGWRVYGAREYEHNRPSALALVAMGVTVGFLFFPKHLVIPTILTMAFVDPVIRGIRDRDEWIYPVLPLCVAMMIFYGTFHYMTDWGPAHASAMTLVGGSLAVAVERPHMEWLDDDLLMILVPMTVLWLITEIYPVT